MLNLFKRNKKQKKIGLTDDIKANEIDNIRLIEIKKFFFSVDGDGMSMWKVDEEKYEQYCMVNEDIVEGWRQELIEEKFKLHSKSKTKNYWITVGRLNSLIAVSKTHIEFNFEKLLTQITEISPFLNKRQRILILEDFAGRNASLTNGAIYYILTKTNLIDALKTTISTLSDFSCDPSDNTDEMSWQNTTQRFENAKNAVQKAFLMFQNNDPFD